MPLKLRMHIQHRLNPLHLYCRLREAGLPRRLTLRLMSLYGRFYRYCGL